MKNIEVVEQTNKTKGDSFYINFRKTNGDVLKLFYIVPYELNYEQAVRKYLVSLYTLFANAPSQKQIDEMITVNVVGYRRGKSLIDVRYSMRHAATDYIVNNVDFEVAADQSNNVFELAIQQCLNDFYQLKAELGGTSFIIDLYEFIKIWDKKHGLP